MKSHIHWSVLIISMQVYLRSAQTLPEGNQEQGTACAGAVLRMACPGGYAIAVKDVRYGTKLTSICALNDNSDACCQYDAGDCFDPPYTGTAEIAACSGYNVCNKDKADNNAVRAGQEDASSCGDGYPDLTHYLVMDYYCIPDSRIGLMTSALLQETDNLLYLQNSDYPTGPIRPTVTTVSCSVETSSCSSQINVYFVHFELSDDGGLCTNTQNLQVDDKEDTHTYTCSDNTDYTINLKLTSTSSYVILTLNNPAGTNDGKFKIGFEATDSSSLLKLACPPTGQMSCQDCLILTPPTSGRLSTTDVTTGTNVDVLCDSGYTLFGEATLDCQTNGTWSAEVGACQKGLGDSCTTPSECSAIADATCKNNECACVAGYTKKNNECTAASSRGLGDSCINPIDCSAVSNATCKNKVCACVDGYTQSNNECTPARSGAGACSRCGIETLRTFCTFVTAIFIFVLGDSSI